MKLAVALAVCALALLDVAKTAPADQSAPQGALRSMSMEMPSLKERLAGARPRRNRGQPRAAPPRRGQAIARSPLRHEGPSVPQPDIAGTTTFHRDDANALIINGDTAVTGQFPWMAAVNIDNMYFCGGSVIAEDWVLTAAHCLDGSTSFTVTAGSLLYKGGEESTRQDSTTTRSIMHPDYSDIFVDNDIGLLQMPKPFVFNDNLRPIRLPSYSQGVDMMVGKKATISGWGVTNDDYYAEKPLSLLYVDLTINDGSACYDYYGNVWIPNKVCFDTSQNQKSSCSGDSGGPLVILEDDGKYTEIGLTSFGASRGCTLGLPIAFTRVASFLEFIETTTGLKARDY